MKYSILIPLEAHRGVAHTCIQGWTRQQAIKRTDYEIVIAAPDAHADGDLRALQRMLEPHDRMESFPYHHDMPLLAEGARMARGDVLVFTEAHCRPEPDFLSRCDEVLAEHPELAGFSGRSLPVAKNLLAEVEADMYVADIERHLTQHPWLKVLDQCFVLRRGAYERIGGIETEFGHFAEWVIAARLRQLDLTVGYDPRAIVHHHYSGDLAELAEFTDDFALGQIRFAARANFDAGALLFDEIAEWSDRTSRSSLTARHAIQTLRQDLGQTISGCLTRPRKLWSGLRRWPWKSLFGAWIREHCPQRTNLIPSQLAVWLARLRITWQLLVRDKESLRKAFLRWLEARVSHQRRRYVADHAGHAPLEKASIQPQAEWLVGEREPLPSAGFGSVEHWEGQKFRWMESLGMIGLPPLAGEWRIRIEWLHQATDRRRFAARFYLDMARIPAEKIRHAERYTDIDISGSGNQSGQVLACICAPIRLPDGRTGVGLPVTRISWTPRRPAPFGSHVPASAMDTVSGPLYFLHVQKCAGTTARLILVNRFHSNQVLAPHVEFYYAHQLPDKLELPDSIAFTSGHFGWELPRATPDRQWNIVTLLREPRERLLSKFDYLVQHGRIAARTDFANWVRNHLQVRDLMSADFVPGLALDETQGITDISRRLVDQLPTAIDNLNSCVAVGLQDRMDDSIDLLCAAANGLPPNEVPQFNRTIRRDTRWNALPTALRREVDSLLVADTELYRHGRLRFEKDWRDSVSTAGAEECLGSEKLRPVLRQRYFRRLAETLEDGAGGYTWEPAEAFHGHNLQQREHHDGVGVRWTGPDQSTSFYAPLVPGRRVRVTIDLHPATPREHALQAQLLVNGSPVPLHKEDRRLWGQFQVASSPSECAPLSECVLTSPINRGPGDFRELGLALTGIRFER